MAKLKVFILTLFCFNALQAQKSSLFPVSDIHEDLLENSDAVIRLHEGHFRIESMDRAVYKNRRVVTVLNKDADYLGWAIASYDKLVKVTDFQAVVYDENGKVVKKLKKSEILDQSSISGFSLYEDNRIKGADLRQKTYPYTVDFTYENTYKYLYGIPDWEVLNQENVSVERSTFTLSAPEVLKPRFKEINVQGKVVESRVGEFLTYEWVFEGLPAQEYEQYTQGEFVDNPTILAAPSKFRYEGYEGDMSTWDDIVKWQFSLNEGRNDLSSAAKEKVKALVADAQTDTEKIKRIYEYVQNRTRYVSIQLGIGGLQPFPTSIVENNGYGDCKALSFYTQALLNEAGIEAHYTWVDAGDNPRKLHKDFPDHYFNHVILSVPNKGDTIWLECTNQTIPMGYLGSFTGDRDVLVMTPEGGKIVHTPVYSGENNQYTTIGEITIDKSGNATSEIGINFKGGATSSTGVLGVIYQNEEEKKEWLRRMIDVPSYELHEYQFEEKKDRIPEVDLNLKMDIRKVASVSGSRLLLQPNLLSARSYVPKTLDRKMPIHYKLSRLENDTLTFNLPDGASIEQLPERIEISSHFGDYSAEFLHAEGRLTYIRTMKYKPGTYEADKYQDLIKFYKSIRRADRKKVIISVKT